VAWFWQISGVVADVSGHGPVQDVDGAYERWFTAHGCQALLARPDFYVFAAGAHADIPRFVSRLRHALQDTRPEPETAFSPRHPRRNA
jgi:hypothetical protein